MPVAKSKNKFRMQPNFQSFCLFPEGILISSLPGLLIFYSVVSFINILSLKGQTLPYYFYFIAVPVGTK